MNLNRDYFLYRFITFLPLNNVPDRIFFMSFFPKSLSYNLEYYLLRVMEKIISNLPRCIALNLGSIVGYILYLSGIYRKTVLGNMRHAGFWSENEIKIIIKRLYINIGKYMIDFLRTSEYLPEHRIHNFELVEKLLSRKKGVIVLLAHFGNWELLAKMFGKKVSDLNVIAKAMKNRKVDQWLAKKRAETGVTTIYTDQALRKMIEVTKRNGLVAILIDQHAGKHGTMIQFLGKPANTVRTVAGIVNKTGCSVLPTYALMSKDGSYDIIISESSEPDLNGKSDEERIEQYQILHNQIISAWIKENPEHYFGWFHKRFRNLISYE